MKSSQFPERRYIYKQMNADAGLTASLVIHFPAGLLLNIGAESPLEYDTKSDFLNMDAQKDAQAICKTLKISDFISPMLGFVKQRIRSPDTLFFYAQAGRLGLTARRRVASELCS